LIISKTLGDEFDGCGGVRDENQVEIVWVSVEELQCSYSYFINAVSSEGGGRRSRMRISIKIRNEIVREFFDEGFGI
jgi:hypothetical protein